MASNEGSKDFWRLIIGFFLPPVGVFMQVGLGLHFWINLVLTFFAFFFPAQIHGAWVIATKGEAGAAEEDGMRSFFSVLLAYYVPPVGVFLKLGIGVQLVLNIVLYVFGWFPGVIHALWIISNHEGE